MPAEVATKPAKPVKPEELTILSKELWELDDKDAVSYVRIKYKDAVNKKRGDFTRCDRYRHIYKALDAPDTRIVKDGSLEGDPDAYANTYLPLIASRIDAGVAQAYGAIFSTADYVDVESNDWLDDFVAPKIKGHILDRHIQMKFRHKVFRALLAAGCYDYGVTLISWRIEPGFIPKRIESINTETFGRVSLPRRTIKTEMKWVPDKVDSPWVYNVSYFNCAHDPYSELGLEDSEYFIDWRWETIGKLKSLAKTDDNPFGKYKNIEAVEQMVLTDNKTNTSTGDPLDVDTVVKGNRVKIIRCHTKHHVVETIGTELVSRRNCYDWEVHMWRWHENTDEFAGIGLAQRAERPQDDVNAELNSRRDWSNKNINPPVIIHDDLLPVHGGMVLTPSKVLTYSSHNKNARDMIYTHQSGVAPPNGAMTELGLEIQAIDDVMGVGPNTLGNYTGGRRTAAQTYAVNAGRTTRFGTLADRFEETVLEPIYQHQILLEALYLTTEQRFKYHGTYGVYSGIVTPEDYKTNGTITIKARGSFYLRDKAVHIQQLMTGLDRALQAPQYNNLEEIFSEMWKEFFPDKFQKFVRNPKLQQLNIPPDLENVMMMNGQKPDVSPLNDSQEHLQNHIAQQQSPDYELWKPGSKLLMNQHIAETQNLLERGAAQVAGARDRSNALTQGGLGGGAQVSQGFSPTSIGVTP